MFKNTRILYDNNTIKDNNIQSEKPYKMLFDKNVNAIPIKCLGNTLTKDTHIPPAFINYDSNLKGLNHKINDTYKKFPSSHLFLTDCQKSHEATSTRLICSKIDNNLNVHAFNPISENPQNNISNPSKDTFGINTTRSAKDQYKYCIPKTINYNNSIPKNNIDYNKIDHNYHYNLSTTSLDYTYIN